MTGRTRLHTGPKYRVINYQLTNKEVGGAIQKALAITALTDNRNPSATVFVGESPGREGWAIHALLVRAGPVRQTQLVMYASETNGTNLVTQRHRVMTWVRLETLLDQVQKWIGGDGEVSLHFNSSVSTKWIDA